MASTYRWIGGTAPSDDPANWELVAGPGNPSNAPENGDEVLIPSGTVQSSDFATHDNTIRMGATTGVAGLEIVGKATRSSPSVDPGSVITTAFVPAGAAVIGGILSAGTFFNQGTIQAAGPVGSAMTIDIQQQGTNPGLFFNEGGMSVAAGNTLAVQVGSNAAFINADLVTIDGGLFRISASPTAIAGGLAPVAGNFVISNSGTLDIATGFPTGTTGQAPLIDFVDGSGTLVVGNPAQFGGRIMGFSAGETIALQAVGTIDQVAYSAGTGVLQLRSGGTTVSSLAFGTGMFSSGTFAVSGGSAGSFGIFQSGSDVAITTTAANTVWGNLSGGLWTTGTNWDGGVAPGLADTAQIGAGPRQDYVVQTGTAAVVVGSLMLGNEGATLAVENALTVATTTLQQIAGVIDVAAGATLVVGAIRQGSESAVLNLAAGSLLEIHGKSNVGLAANGGTLTTGGGNNVGLLVNGTVVADGATINAGPTQSSTAFTGGFITIGLDSGATPAVVEVKNGATVTDTYAVLSSDPTSFGMLTISGVNTVWHDAGDPTDTQNTRGVMVVGSNNSPIPARPSGVAQLTLTDGARLIEESRGAIGNTANSQGSVTVSGGAVWSIGNQGTITNGVLRVGQGGIGTLRVLNQGTVAGNGGTVSVGGGNQTIVSNGTTSVLGNALSVGANAGAFGTVVVAGSGSKLTTAGSNVVGDAGTGTLLVGGVIGEGLPDGGLFSSTGSLIVGNQLGGSGIVRVGTGGTIALTGSANVTRLRVGNTAPSGTLAAIGQVEVAGTGALLTADGGINIGRNGTGILTIADGGQVVSKTSDQVQAAAMFVGQFGTGTVTVEGAGAQLLSQGLAIVGRQGNGTVTIGNGGTFAVVQDIGTAANKGQLQIGGGSGNTVGQQGGSGTIVVNAGGLLSSDGVINVGLNGDQGVLAVNGGSVTVAGSVVAGITSVSGTTVFDNASGTISVGAGGHFTVGGSLISSPRFTLGSGKNASGALSVTGGTVANAGQFLVGAAGSGSASIQGAGTVAGVMNTNGMVVAGGSTAVGSLSIGAGGTLADTAGITVAGQLGADGTITLSGGGRITSTGSFATVGFNGTGTLSVSSGSSFTASNGALFAGFSAGSSGVLLVNGGTLATSGANIGWAGNGLATVSGGGTLDAGGNFIQLGGTTGSSGQLTVSGGHIGGSGLTVGGLGQGSASLTGSATGSIGANGILIATGTASTGTLVVSGSTLSTTGGLSVGDRGAGSLSLVSGAVMNVGTAFAVSIGGIAGATGTVTVTGATLQGTGVAVGNQGTGFLNINAGGLVDAGVGFLAIGFGSGGSGTVNLSGSNARLLSTGLQMDASVSADATARLAIGAGATAAVGAAFMGANSLIELSGGLLDVDSLGIQSGGTVQGFGLIDGSIITSGTIRATGGTMEVTGSLSGGAHIANLGTLKLDAAASSSVTFDSGTAQVLMLQTPGTIFTAPLRGLFTNDQIQFNFGPGVTIASASVLPSGSDIQITKSDLTTYFLSDVGFDDGSLTNLVTGFDAASGNSFIQIGCFVSGTLIETAAGEVAVETLKQGDLVPTVLGAAPAPVVWLGRRHVDCDAQPDPRKVWPVRVAAHAFGPNLPRRDLWLSPDHAIYVHEVLIPVIRLVNGNTIRQVPVAEVTYWHVQLPHHDVIRAEGLPAESFLDTEDRSNFENGGVPMRLFPDFNARMWEAGGCAELVQVGPKLEAVRRMLAGLAERSDQVA